MLASLRHSNLPGVIDHFHIVGQGQYLVMSFIEGEDLAQRLKRLGPLPENDLLRWADDVLNAIAYLHKRGIVHRDIKPNNLKVTRDGEVVLVDFGIAKETFNETDATTTTGAHGLTPGFAPPEQYGGTRTDARSDIYAFGATLYTLLTGVVPPDAISRLTKPEKYMPLGKHEIWAGKALTYAVDKALDLDADKRWQTAEAMKIGLQTPARSLEDKLPKSLDEIETASVKEVQTSTSLPKTRHPFLSLNVPSRILGLVGIITLAIIAIYAMRGQGSFLLATNTIEPTKTEIVVTATVRPTDTPVPTNTATFTATSTKRPTRTPRPTSTRTPIAPAVVLPKPTLSNSINAIIDAGCPNSGPAVVRVSVSKAGLVLRSISIWIAVGNSPEQLQFKKESINDRSFTYEFGVDDGNAGYRVHIAVSALDGNSTEAYGSCPPR